MTAPNCPDPKATIPDTTTIKNRLAGLNKGMKKAKAKLSGQYVSDNSNQWQDDNAQLNKLRAQVQKQAPTKK